MTEKPTTIRQLVEEVAGEKDKGAAVEKMQKKYGEQRLNLTIETAEEIAAAKEHIQAELNPSANYTESYLGKYFDSLAGKEQAEDEVNKLPGVKAHLGGVETVEDLAKLPLETLLNLEDNYPGILLYAFTDIIGAKEKVDFKNWKGYTDLPPGTRLQVDFRGNDEANSNIGAGELLPPKVRCVTVYEDGNQENARTSLRRVGLKSRNEDVKGVATGFFDKRGYITVFTGDVMEIPAKTATEQKVIDEDFEKKFTKQEGEKKVLDYQGYNTSEEAKEDDAFLQKLLQENPAAQRGKTISAEELDQLQLNIEASGKGARVVEAAKKIVEGNFIIAAHCWDFVDKVYKSAGARMHRIFQDLNYTGKDCGTHHAGPEMMARIAPGDWLYYNNKNNADRKGCHSGIFMGWKNEGAKIAWICSWNGKQKRSRIHEADLKAKPVTHITKPV